MKMEILVFPGSLSTIIFEKPFDQFFLNNFNFITEAALWNQRKKLFTSKAEVYQTSP